jgi:hypothetical protein
MGNDAKSLFSVIAATLLFLGGAGWWYSEGLGNGGKQFFGVVEPNTEARERTCSFCQGEGKTSCGRCGGLGQLNYIGKGVSWCNVCNGSRKERCSACKGQGTITDVQPGVLKWGGNKNR